MIFNFWVGLAVLILVVVKSSIKLVPQNRAYVVERFGKYNKTMEAGLNMLVPFVDKVSYDRSRFDVPNLEANAPLATVAFGLALRQPGDSL